MQMNEMILISVDDHICEPPDMFDQHTPSAFKGKMPRVIEKDGLQAWVFGDRVMPNIALNAVVGRRPEEYGIEHTSLDQLRKGCYQVDARIDDMNVNGIQAGLNFPTFPGIAGQLLLGEKDKALALAVIQSYNDWHIDEWCGTYPDRFIPCALIPLWDPEKAAEEVRRIKDKGCNSITMLPNPVRDNLPSIHDPYWKPLWAACDENEVVINLHIAEASNAIPSMDSPVDVFIANMPVTLYATASDLVFSRILRDFSNIKFALSEGGAGWVPHFLERIDYVYQHHGAWTRQDFNGKLPSELFLEHCYTCFIKDDTAIKMRDLVGLDTLTWECDYPHSDCTWPNSPEVLWKDIKDIPKEDIDKITHLNAMRAYQFNPFEHVDRNECTVGALRAKAVNVDTSYLNTEGAGKAPSSKDEGPVTMREVTKQLSESFSLTIDAAE